MQHPYPTEHMKKAVKVIAKEVGKHPYLVTYRDMYDAGYSSRQLRKFIPWKQTLEGWFGTPESAVSKAFVEIGDIDANSKEETLELAARQLAYIEEAEKKKSTKRVDTRNAQAAARDLLVLRRIEDLVKANISPTLKAVRSKVTSKKVKTRVANLVLSDLHIGADIDPREFPEGYGLVEAGRRLAKIALETSTFKIQYRDRQHLNVFLNGDIMQGELGHDREEDMDGAIQFAAALHFLVYAIRWLVAEFPTVKVWCQTGNHGRDINRHPKRALNHKWNSRETELYFALKTAFEPVKNVEFDIRRQQITVVPVFGQHIAMTHGDTALKLGSPRKQAELFEKALEQLNGNMTLGEHIDLLLVGHFHEPHHMIFKAGYALVNGALIPPNGYARTLGYENQCGQWIWESVDGYVFGDSRFLTVGGREDKDASLDCIIPPFQW